MSDSAKHSRALILPGGGARASYQVGVLKAIAEILPNQKHSPFRIFSGTSAGSINAAVLASNAKHFQHGMKYLEGVWANFTVDQVFKTDTWTVMRNTAHWVFTVLSAGRFRSRPTSVLNNAPLRALLKDKLKLERIDDALQEKIIDGLVVVCSSYATALSVSFFQARKDEKRWQRFRRVGQPTEITVEHLMASVAIPYLFPAVDLDDQFYADGAVRQAKPLSPALHLGADRVLVIGVRDEKTDVLTSAAQEYPGLGKIAGYLLDTLFMDGLFNDIDHMLHVNQLLERCVTEGHQQQSSDKRIACHVIVPSEDIREIALKHRERLPRSVRMLLAGGGNEKSGSQLASYLLFDHHYTQDLIALGYADAKQQKAELEMFFSDDEIPDLTAPEHIKESLLSSD